MAYPRNMEIGVQGSSITLDVYFYEYDGGSLTDPDSIPTYKIYDPNDTLKASGNGIKDAVGSYHATYTLAADATISTEWRIEWTAEINSVPVPDAIEYFRVVAVGSANMGFSIIIETKWMNRIKTVLAYPKVNNIILTDEQIINFCVEPAIRQYFTKFPKKDIIEYAITSNAELEVDYPDDYTFGVTDARIVNKDIMEGISNYSIWELANYQKFGLGIKGSYGIPGYNPNFLQQSEITRNQALLARKQTYETIMIKIDTDNKKVIAYTNQSAKLLVEWAKYSDDFSDIKYQYIEDVIKLAQSYILLHLADTTSIIQDSAAEISVNSDELKTRATELQDSVFEKWNEIPSIVLVKM